MCRLTAPAQKEWSSGPAFPLKFSANVRTIPEKSHIATKVFYFCRRRSAIQPTLYCDMDNKF